LSASPSPSGPVCSQLVDAGAYDGTSFYRSTRLAVPGGPQLVQGGPLSNLFAPASADAGPAERPALLRNIETTTQTGLAHERGTISLARDLLDTGHALPDFFLCLGAFPQLDHGGRTEPDDLGFPAFGEVVDGLDRVAKIAVGETLGPSPIPRLEGEILTRPVAISRARRR